MKASRANENLAVLGHKVQIFVDILPYTIQKRRALKPLLQTLSRKAIKYWWSFSLCMYFTNEKKKKKKGKQCLVL